MYLHGVLDEEEARYVSRKTHETLMEKKYGTEADLTDDEREIILKGCLINYYAQNK